MELFQIGFAAMSHTDLSLELSLAGARDGVIRARGVAAALGVAERERVVVIDEQDLLVAAMIDLSGYGEHQVLPGAGLSAPGIGAGIGLAHARRLPRSLRPAGRCALPSCGPDRRRF